MSLYKFNKIDFLFLDWNNVKKMVLNHRALNNLYGFIISCYFCHILLLYSLFTNYQDQNIQQPHVVESYLVLSRIWAGAWQTIPVKTQVIDLTIHGLWLNYMNGSYPIDCSFSCVYSSNVIENITNTLSTEWQTYSNEKNEELWKHEWCKHGTCITHNQYEYFIQTLGLYNQVNLLNILMNGGIYPDDNLYTSDSIKKIIENALGATIVLTCESNGNVFEGVFLCYTNSFEYTNHLDYTNISDYALINCPTTLTSNCNKWVRFLQIIV